MKKCSRYPILFGIIGETGFDYIIERKEELIFSNLNLREYELEDVIKQLKISDINDVPKYIKRIIKRKFAFLITLDEITTVYLLSNCDKDRLCKVGSLIEQFFNTIYKIYSEMNFYNDNIFKKHTGTA